ncbi:glutathione hydrolase 1 proenzyme-like [Physella acuta]|uniref:glutathione hydrolase 1 proenzyme-like n=1 Tax=Physella acuta TaxID=109671 RepID=UPI0027DD25DF|nr:glutathione hydrolase 1 proenzyme-like [Physella acuta]
MSPVAYLLLVWVSGALAFLIGPVPNLPMTGPATGEEGKFRFAAVASNTDTCARVGTDMMAKNGGNAVDGMVATLICNGLVRYQSSGIGGDSMWTIYHRKTGQAYAINARSTAPKASYPTMYANSSRGTIEGGSSVAVPGEVLGMWEAHQLLGRLPWKELFQPSIRLALEGFPCEPIQASAIRSQLNSGVYDRWPQLRNLVTNPETQTWYRAGETVRNPKLAHTLQRLADGGAAEFYNGSLADDMVAEIQAAGGIITKEDFSSYAVQFQTPLRLDLHGNLTIFSPGLPSSGPVLHYILNILSGYQMSPDDISTDDKTVLTYHRMIESFKHAYSARSKMGSTDGETADFVREMEQLVANITSRDQGEAIRASISDTTTYPWTSYHPSFVVTEDHGTSNLAVLGPDGDAVTVTSTVNLFFGSKVVGDKTGVVYNNLMDDFSVPDRVNDFDVEPSPANFIKPGKRPLSSMSPSVVVDQEGQVVLAVGAGGGTKITTTTAFLTAMTLWMGEGIKSSIDAPRIHHQLYPDVVEMTAVSPQWLLEGLRHKGHNVTITSGVFSSPTGILQRQEGAVTANAQNATVDGY